MHRRSFGIAALLLGPVLSFAATDVPSVEQVRAAARTEMLAAIPHDQRIVMKATSPAKHRVTVFTDIDCRYCRQFHQQVEDYLRAGIEVQYVFYPRAGRDSPGFGKAVAVWCSSDRQAALASALNDRAVPLRTCKNPVEEHYELALRLGLLGTPALITEDGAVMYGVMAVSRLLDRWRPGRAATSSGVSPLS